MPTNRQKRIRVRKQPAVAPWAKKYLADRRPPKEDQPGHREWSGWYFFGDHVEGLAADWRELPPVWEKLQCL